MSDFLKIHYEDEYDFAKKILNCKNSVLNKDLCFETYFLTPSQIEITKNILGKEVNYNFYGGEEYKRVKIWNNYEKDDKGITCFKVVYNKNFGSVDHRSILGSLLGLGIKREVIGDIYIDGDDAYFLCVNEMKDYIKENLIKVGRVSVELVENEMINIRNVGEEKNIVVSSLRVDTILAGAFNLSRDLTKDLINKGFAKVNYKIIDSANLLCNNKNTVISLRGYGRVVIKDFISTTKKNKQVLKVEIFKKR